MGEKAKKSRLTLRQIKTCCDYLSDYLNFLKNPAHLEYIIVKLINNLYDKKLEVSPEHPYSSSYDRNIKNKDSILSIASFYSYTKNIYMYRNYVQSNERVFLEKINRSDKFSNFLEVKNFVEYYEANIESFRNNSLRQISNNNFITNLDMLAELIMKFKNEFSEYQKNMVLLMMMKK